MNLMKFRRTTKAKEVLIFPKVLLEKIGDVIENSEREVVALLGGRIEGTYLVISDIFQCKRSSGTKTNVTIDPEDMIDAQASFGKGNYTVGWAHGHLGYGVFMSGTDIATQTDFQEVFPDSVALVVDPFFKGNLSFGFFRVKNKKAYEMDYQFLV